MYTLKDITTYSLIYLKLIPEPEITLLKKYHITNFYELEELLSKNIPELCTPLIFELMRLAYKVLKDIKEERVNPKTFTWNHNQTYLDTIKNTDQNTKGSALFYNVVNSNSGIYEHSLNDFDIYTLKYLTSKIALNGKNAAQACILGIGSKKLIDLAFNIKQYDEQINRVVKSLTIPQDINLFLYNQEQKRTLVEKYKEELIRYLFSLTNTFTFGYISSRDKEIILKVLRNQSHSLKYQSFLTTILDFIANYTIISELEAKDSRELTLQRFVK